jgi:hypothetical protein
MSGIFQSISETVKSFSPVSQAASVAKFVIIGVLVLIGMFMIWVVFLKKDSFTSLSSLGPSMSDRQFGVYPSLKKF